MGYKSAELNNAEANERKNLLKIRCADLVQVTAFDAGKMTVNVKPLVKREIGGCFPASDSGREGCKYST